MSWLLCCPKTNRVPKKAPAGLQPSNLPWHYWRKKQSLSRPIKEGLPSSLPPWAAKLSAGLDDCRALARLQGRLRQRQLTGHFFPSRILAIFSQLSYATDITCQWVYELKIKWALSKPLLLFCHLVNSLPELPCSYTRDTSLCPATAQEKWPSTSALQTACNNPPQLLHLNCLSCRERSWIKSPTQSQQDDPVSQHVVNAQTGSASKESGRCKRGKGPWDLYLKPHIHQELYLPAFLKLGAVFFTTHLKSDRLTAVLKTNCKQGIWSKCWSAQANPNKA